MRRPGVHQVVILAIAILLLLFVLQLSIDGTRGDGSGGRKSTDFKHGRLPSWRSELTKDTQNGWYTFKPLSSAMVNSVDRFVFFVGYARSGHSIIGSFLDAHPNVVIADEYALFNRWRDDPHLYRNKSELFNALYYSSYLGIMKGYRKNKPKKGYSLAIPGWYQGTYQGRVSVIGDKAGGMTAQVYRMDKELFGSIYRQLESTVMIPLQAIHVVRNPYDNIATMLLYNHRVKQKANETHKYHNEQALKNQIVAYFNQIRSVLEMIEKYSLDVHTIHNRDFITDPSSTMKQLCLTLHLQCSDEYLQMVSERTFSRESYSRNSVQWTPELLALVEENIKKYPLLTGYTFQIE